MYIYMYISEPGLLSLRPMASDTNIYVYIYMYISEPALLSLRPMASDTHIYCWAFFCPRLQHLADYNAGHLCHS